MIAIDCLKKLSAHLPDYQRLMHVSLSIIESGLYLPVSTDDDGGALSTKRFYFEEVGALLERLANDHQAIATVCQVSQLSDQQETPSTPPRERILQLLGQMKDEGVLEKEKLFMGFLQSNMDLLSSLACSETLKYFIGHPDPGKREFFYSMLTHQLDSDAGIRLLSTLLHSHGPAFKRFLHENFPAMDKILIDCDAAAKTSLFHRLVDRHATEFATVLWQSPYLTAHIFQVCTASLEDVARSLISLLDLLLLCVFQGSQHLIARILEQNTFLISQTLGQKPDLLLSLLNHALRDNTVRASRAMSSSR